jgi:hypothetical protein
VSNRYIGLAKEELLKGLREAERAVQTFKEHIAAIEAVERRSVGNLEHLPPIRENEFKGNRAVKALDSYLRGRRGLRIPLSRVVADLVEGAADPGAPRGNKKDPAELIDHTLKLSLGNLPRLLDYEPKMHYKTTRGRDRTKVRPDTPSEDILVWLADTADEPKRRQRPKK